MIKSWAKVNLFLEIKEKRKDNYHNIISFTSLIDIYDEILIIPNKKSKMEIICQGFRIPTGKENIMWKVLTYLKRKFLVTDNFTIFINKKIPPCSGLGGGSSNAGECIKWFLKKYNVSLTPKIEKDIFLIGSDILLFLKDHKQLIVEQKGNLINPYHKKLSLSFYIIKPPQGINTSLAYQCLSEKKKCGLKFGLSSWDKFLKDPKNYQYWKNDFEKILQPCFPKIYDFKRRLEKNFEFVFLCGSGSAFIALSPRRPIYLKEYNYIIKTKTIF